MFSCWYKNVSFQERNLRFTPSSNVAGCTLFPSTHICLVMKERLSWCVSETCAALSLKREPPKTARPTWWMNFVFEDFWRLGESGSVFLARKEMRRAVYTFKGLEPFFYHQCTLSWWSGPGISLSERTMNRRAGEYHDFPRCPCFCW